MVVAVRLELVGRPTCIAQRAAQTVMLQWATRVPVGTGLITLGQGTRPVSGLRGLLPGTPLPHCFPDWPGQHRASLVGGGGAALPVQTC